jgi:hypothetical protein
MAEIGSGYLSKELRVSRFSRGIRGDFDRKWPEVRGMGEPVVLRGGGQKSEESAEYGDASPRDLGTEDIQLSGDIYDNKGC